MDFFGILFDIKNGKKIPYSKTYFDTLFAAKLGGSDVKTITGALPLTFTTSETALRSWTIYGADIEHVETASGKSITFYTDEDKLRDWSIYGNSSIGKNKLEITVPSGTVKYGGANLSYTIDKTAGTITLDGTSRTDSEYIVITFSNSTAYGDYIISGGSEFASYRIWDATSNAYARKTDNSSVAESFGGDSTVRLPENHTFSHRVRVTPQATFDNVVLHLMLRPANTTADFEPYQQGVGKQRVDGYYVPLKISQTGQPDKTYDIFIGDSPLTEGETVSKQSTGVDIATADGTNTITTSLSNQPDMSITYNEFTGVGILTANLFIIALKLQAGGQTLNVFNTTLNKPLRAGETLTSEQTGQTINTVAGVENKLSPSPKAAAYGGNFEMTIKFKE